VDELGSRIVEHVTDALEVAGVGEGVVDRDRMIRGREDVTDVVRSDEPGGAGDEQFHVDDPSV